MNGPQQNALRMFAFQCGQCGAKGVVQTRERVIACACCRAAAPLLTVKEAPPKPAAPPAPGPETFSYGGT